MDALLWIPCQNERQKCSLRWGKLNTIYQESTRTVFPVSLEEARRIFQALVPEKRATGYVDSLYEWLIKTNAGAHLDGETWFMQQGQRHLPQGAPTSPAITNLICRRFDRRLRGAAQSIEFTYTRYTDDLTLSASGDAASDVGRMLWLTRKIIEEEGFAFHPDKLRIMRKGLCQRAA